MSGKTKAGDLEVAPEPNISYEDGDSKLKQAAFAIARTAYAAKHRGEVTHWKDCAQMIKVRACLLPHA